jgi:hypothetical protein
MPSGDDKPRLNFRVLPSWRLNRSTSPTTPHSTRKQVVPKDFRPFRISSCQSGFPACGSVGRKYPPVILSADGAQLGSRDRSGDQGDSQSEPVQPTLAARLGHQPHGETGWKWYSWGFSIFVATRLRSVRSWRWASSSSLTPCLVVWVADPSELHHGGNLRGAAVPARSDPGCEEADRLARWRSRADVQRTRTSASVHCFSSRPAKERSAVTT